MSVVDGTGGIEGAAGAADGGPATSTDPGAPAPAPIARFFGEFKHHFDDKGRVFMPAAFRPGLGAVGYASWGREGCISVYPQDEFVKVADEISEGAREGGPTSAAADAFFAAAAAVPVDGQGRVTISKTLLEFAGLAPAGDVIVTGAGRRIQLWDPQRWQRRRDYGVGAIDDGVLAQFGY